MSSEPDYYEVLQLPASAKRRAIVASYRRLARRYHPDVNPEASAGQRMSAINKALEVLSDPEKRAAYDRRRLRSIAVKAMGERPSPGPPPEIQQSSQGRHLRRWRLPRVTRPLVATVVIVIGLLTGIALGIALDTGGRGSIVRLDPTAAQISAPPSSAVPSATPTAGVASPSRPAGTPRQGSGTFSNGTWLVGQEIAAGMWRAIRSQSCSWKRLAAPSGTQEDVLGSGSSLTVQIEPTDAAFWSVGCGWWTQIMEPPSASPTDPFGPGTWLINQEIAPGLWQNSDSSEGCTWVRLRRLDGVPSAANANGSTNSSRVTIAISGTDRAFDSKGCGTWTRVGN